VGVFWPEASGAEAMKECYQYTDLEWRLAQIPDWAACRGVFFNMLDDRARDFEPRVQREYRQFFKLYKFSSLRLYPVKDYLTRMVKLAQIQFGGPNIYKGIYAIQAASWPAWRRTLVGRTAFGIFGNDFASILRFSKRPVQNAINYGSFDFSGGPNHFVTYHRNEYNYIQYSMAGGIAGMAEVCGVKVSIEPRLSDPFNGELHIEVLQPSIAAVP
jgi:hypothetical protein